MNPSSSSDTAEFQFPQGKWRDRPESYSARVEADLGGLSHVGKVRTNNEDHFLIARFGRFLESLQSNLPENAVPLRSEESGFGMAVADGMGGAAAGEEASRRAIMGFVNLVLRTPDWILRLDDEPLTDEVLRRAADRYEKVNESLEEQARDDPGLRGYGTTMTVACSIGRELFVAHLGDSRAYLFRGGRLQQLTRDHTLAQELLDRNVIDRAEAASHRLRHALTQSLGDHGRAIQPEVLRVSLEDGDCLLLCTDGLSEMVDGDSIGTILGSGAPARTLCERLVDAALAAGGKDNVTAVVARYRMP